MNWVCVMAKADLPAPGLEVVYFEIDSILPDVLPF